MQLRLHCSFRHTQLRCDFSVLIPLYLVKHKGDPRSFRQRCDSPIEIHFQLRTRAQRDRANRSRIFHRQHSGRAAFLRPRRLEHRIHCQPVKPRRERTLTSKISEPAPGANEDILHELSRLSRRAPGKSKTQRKYPGRMLTVQRLECRSIARLCATNQVIR